jgi:hypothetical protein
LFVLTVVVAAVGVVGLGGLVRSWGRGVLSLVLVVVAVVALGTQAWSSVRSHDIPDEDVRDQAAYVAAHAKADDVIVVNMNSNWGFGYYWPVGVPAIRPDAANDQGYEVRFPGQSVVVATDRDGPAVAAAVDDALAVAGRHPGARMWLVRAHVIASEQAAWQAALNSHGLTAVAIGTDGLSVVDPGR